MFFTLGYALQVVEYFVDYDYYYSSSDTRTIVLASWHLINVAFLFSNIASIFLLVTFVELGTGFLLCTPNPIKPGLRKSFRLAILSLAAVLLILMVAYFGVQAAWYVDYWKWVIDPSADFDDYDPLSLRLASINRLGGAFDVLMWIATIPMVALASFVVHKVKGNPLLRNVRVLLSILTSSAVW